MPTPITAVEKTTGSSTVAGTTHATASVTPTANRGYLLWVFSAAAATAVGPTGVSGMGMSWTKITEETSPALGQNISVWKALSATPSAGALTITWAAATETVGWKLDEFDQIDPAGFVRTANVGVLATTNATPSFNLPTGINSNGAVIAGICYGAGTTQTIAASGSGYALLGTNISLGGSPVLSAGVEYNSAPTNNTVAFTCSSAANKAIAAVELVPVPIAPTILVTATEKLSNGSTTSLTAYTTASWTPTSGRGYLLWVSTSHATAAVAPSSVTGNGLTWVKHKEVTSSNGVINLSLWRTSTAAVTGSAGAITINYAAGPNSSAWKLDELSNMNPSGTSGSGMLRATNDFTLSVTGSAPSGTLAQTPNVNNGIMSAMGYNAGSAQAVTAGTGFTLLGTTVALATTQPMQLSVEWDQDGGSTGVSWTTGNGSSKGILAVEVVAASPSPVVDAGGNQTVDAFDLVSFSGSASGGTPPYTQLWTGPGGITITNPTTMTPSFRAPASLTTQTYTFTLTVTDAATIASADTVDVTVDAHNLWTWRGATPGGALVAKWTRTRRGGVLIG